MSGQAKTRISNPFKALVSRLSPYGSFAEVRPTDNWALEEFEDEEDDADDEDDDTQ
jgi:hypothetical protein